MPQLPKIPATLPQNGPVALKARRLVPLAEKAPVSGRALFAHPAALDNGCMVIENGIITAIGQRIPPGCPVFDLGDAAILPPLANAHTHLQLSWLAGQTLWGHGFTPWLRSMLPLLLPVSRASFASPERLAALDTACAGLAGAIVGDVGASIAGAVSAVHAAARRYNLHITHFCEHFGFEESNSAWPSRAEEEIVSDAHLAAHCSPAGHGLYSTSGEVMRRAKEYCREHHRIFSFHLAESPEETELLLTGTGPLAGLYRDVVLPPGWMPPGLRPFALALRLGLLDAGSLAVHGVQLEPEEIKQLAATEAALCLCPRSNANLGVGAAPVLALAEQGVRLCLGTDGLTSSPDLDVRREAFYLRENSDMPLCALWRMATINGAAAIGYGSCGLHIGAPAAFSLWPLDN